MNSDQQNSSTFNVNEAESYRTIAYRPITSNGFRHPFNLGDPIGSTHYDSTFTWDPTQIDRAEAIRTGTSSGARANKPHPTREFMVFRFRAPLKKSFSPDAEWSQPIGDRLLSQCIRSQMKSVYSTDYVNNVEVKKKFETEQEFRPTSSCSKRKSQQTFEPFKYNEPFTYESLYISPTRFRKKAPRPAHGILPNIGGSF